jgi:hypothetical protein
MVIDLLRSRRALVAENAMLRQQLIVAERLIGTLRRECLDHMLIWSEPHLQRVLDEYRQFYNDARPHQGIEQLFAMPARSEMPVAGATVASRAVLGGLLRDYRIAA